MLDWLRWLLETDAYRHTCPSRAGPLTLAFAIGDGMIFLAYMLIPVALGWWVLKRRYAPRREIIASAALFILCCGFTHLLKVLAPLWPAYNLALVVTLATGVISLLVAGMVLVRLPELVNIRSVQEAERGIASSRNHAVLAQAIKTLRDVGPEPRGE